MDLKPSEIVVLVLAVMAPILLFAILIFPSFGSALLGLFTSPTTRPYMLSGAVVLTGIVLGYRMYNRYKPRRPTRDPNDTTITGLFKKPDQD